MKILIIGKSGQLARELANLHSLGTEIICFGREDIDLFDTLSLISMIKDNGFDAVINTAAYTAVDLAEKEISKAVALNVSVVENLAMVCKQLNIYLVHISTDFVFDGSKSSPYTPDDKTNPLSVYGKTKRDGELKLLENYGNNSCIVRTSWLYSSFANNFVKSMLNLMNSKDKLGIVADQVGTPTYAAGLASAILEIVSHRLTGIYHWSDAGVASWYDFAVAIQEMAIDRNMLDRKIPIKSIKTEEYPTPAERPCYSLMDKSKLLEECPDLENIHWRTQLGAMLDELERS